MELLITNWNKYSLLFLKSKAQNFVEEHGVDAKVFTGLVNMTHTLVPPDAMNRLKRCHNDDSRYVVHIVLVKLQRSDQYDEATLLFKLGFDGVLLGTKM